MAEVTEATFNDEHHWRVDLHGRIGGREERRSYHLAAESLGEAKVNALRRFSAEWDEVPLVSHAERYRTWRAHEPEQEGQCGMSGH